MNETSTYAATGTASRRQWESGPGQQMEWIREMRPERQTSRARRCSSTDSKEPCIALAVHAELD